MKLSNNSLLVYNSGQNKDYKNDFVTKNIKKNHANTNNHVDFDIGKVLIL